MAGTATIRNFVAITELGHFPPFSTEYTITGIDEGAYRYEELAAEAAIAIDVGVIDTVNGLVIRLVSGGTTAATGLSVDLSTATWAATDFVILSGDAIFLRPSVATISMKNLSTETTAVVEYLVFGDNE